jgi:threonine aldolase
LATTFAKGLGDLEGVEVDAAAVETNIVRFGLKIASAAKFVEECHRHGVWMLPTGPRQVRSVFISIFRRQTSSLPSRSSLNV